MKIKKITHQHRNDFHAIMECEGCGHTQKLLSGYDDRYYHKVVIPAQPCEACGKCRNEFAQTIGERA